MCNYVTRFGRKLLSRLSCIMRNYVDGIGTRSLDNLEENY